MAIVSRHPTSNGVAALRLGAFKSHLSQTMQLEPVTLLVGRNGSGKSNALDALSLLALLADERDVNDLERGDQEVAGLRGGLSGASPFGDAPIKIGCTIDLESGGQLLFDIELDATAPPEIVSEKLELRRSRKHPLVLMDCHRKDPGAGITDARVYSSGAPRTYQFLSSRLAVAQAMTKVPGDTKARRLVVSSCNSAIAALRGVFVLDPVPAQMRDYTRIGSAPDRSGSTLSALVYGLQEDRDAWERLTELVRALVETEVIDITFSEGRLPDNRLVDVMVALVKRAGDREFTAPARLMSDGTLRYLAIVASLLDLPTERGDRVAVAEALGPVRRSSRTLVLEEIENGLFPSQAARVLDLLRSEARARDIRLVATTHSPALLDALRPEDHAGVIICDRGKDGRSTLRRLVDHERYVEIAGSGAVGRAVTQGMLEGRDRAGPTSLADLFAS